MADAGAPKAADCAGVEGNTAMSCPACGRGDALRLRYACGEEYRLLEDGSEGDLLDFDEDGFVAYFDDEEEPWAWCECCGAELDPDELG